MPYIRPKLRNNVGDDGKSITPGELNYLITMACHEYIIRKKVNYAVLNEVIGVLECAKLELYRMVAAPYENKKRFDNGCISDLDMVDGKSY